MFKDPALLVKRNPLLDRSDGEKSFSVIRAILQMNNLAQAWQRFIGRQNKLETKLLKNTIRTLREHGISKDSYLAYLRHLLCYYLFSNHPQLANDPDIVIDQSIERTWHVISIAVVCDLIPTDNAKEFLILLELEQPYQLEDDDCLQLWSSVVGGVGDFFDNIDTDIGVPFSVLEDRFPDILAWRAYIFYNCGHSGDEDLARRMAVKAAFSGSEYAWELLTTWAAECDDGEEVLAALLESGKEFSLAPPSSLPDFAQKTMMELRRW